MIMPSTFSPLASVLSRWENHCAIPICNCKCYMWSPHWDSMICSLQMAVLEIQANGDSAVSKEAIVNAGHSLEDPLMRVSVKNTLRPRYAASQQGWLFCMTLLTHPYRFISRNWSNPERCDNFILTTLQEFTQSCLRHEAKIRPTAHDLLFHRVLFEVHSLKLLAAHCLINNQCEFLTSTRWA